MRYLLFAFGAWIGASLIIAAWICLKVRTSRLERQTAALTPAASDGVSGSDPLDSMTPEERELFLEAWWSDVMSMPEYELEAAEVAYLNWVKALPEAVS
jgi:hypothetical protein